MTCPDCGANLDTVPIGAPCPTCGSLRRDASVSVPTIEAKAIVHPPTIIVENASEGMSPAEERPVAHLIDAILSQPGVREVAETGELVLRFNPPSEDALGWIVQAWHKGKLISMAPGDKFEDAYLAMGDEIEEALTDGGNETPPA